MQTQAGAHVRAGCTPTGTPPQRVWAFVGAGPPSPACSQRPARPAAPPVSHRACWKARAAGCQRQCWRPSRQACCRWQACPPALHSPPPNLRALPRMTVSPPPQRGAGVAHGTGLPPGSSSSRWQWCQSTQRWVVRGLPHRGSSRRRRLVLSLAAWGRSGCATLAAWGLTALGATCASPSAASAWRMRFPATSPSRRMQFTGSHCQTAARLAAA